MAVLTMRGGGVAGAIIILIVKLSSKERSRERSRGALSSGLLN